MATTKVNNVRTTSGNEVPIGGRLQNVYNITNSNRTLANNSGWVNHLTGNIGVTKNCNLFCMATTSSGYESGAVEGFIRLVFNGTNYFGNCQAGRNGNNSSGCGSCTWVINGVNPGNYSYQIQARNWINGTRWIMNYWSPDQNYTRDTVLFWFQ